MRRVGAVLSAAAAVSGETCTYKYVRAGEDFCEEHVQWADPALWDPAPPTAEDTAVFSNSARPASCAWGDRSGKAIASDTENVAPLPTNTSYVLVIKALQIEGIAFAIARGSIEVTGGVTLSNASLSISTGDPDGWRWSSSGTTNAEQYAADAASAAKGFLSCADIPTGFQPRICGAGALTVGKGSSVTVQGTYASLFVPVTVEQGGTLFMTDNSFAWKAVDNAGLVNIDGARVYWHGQLHNKAGGVVTTGSYTAFIFDLWADRTKVCANETVVPTPEVTTIINDGTFIIGAGGQLWGSSYYYGLPSEGCSVYGTYTGTLENSGTLLSAATNQPYPLNGGSIGVYFRVVNNDGGRVTLAGAQMRKDVVNKGTVTLTGGVLQDVENQGTLTVTGAVLRGGVQNVGRMRVSGGEVAAQGRVANRRGAELALDGVTLHGPLDNAGAVRVTGTSANKWGGAVSNAAGGVLGVDGGDVYVTSLRSEGGTIDLRRGAQINYQSTGGGDYCWESVSKYCGSCNCNGCTCRCCSGADNTAALLTDIPPLTSRFARNTTFPERAIDHPSGSPAAASAVVEDYSFTNSVLTGDGTGSMVFAGEMGLHGGGALSVRGARVFTVAEHKVAAVAGGGELVVGDGGAVYLGLDATLGSGGRVTVQRGGLLGVDPHARVYFGNHSVHVAPGGVLHVDGHASFASAAGLRMCGRHTGGGELSGAAADRC